jgi:multiple sugar transport system permease protein
MFDLAIKTNSDIWKMTYKNPQVIRNKSVATVVWLLRWLFIIGLFYLFLFPLLFMIATSLQDPKSVNDPSIIFIPKTLSLTSIGETIKFMDYWRSAGLTLFISVTSTLSALISCSLVGYGFARFKFFGKNILFALVVLTIIVPPQTILPSMVLSFHFFNFGGLLSLLPGSPSINILNTPLTFILPSLFATGLRSGLFIFIFRQFFIGMPKSLEEAARIDGCGALQTFVRIIVPLAVPVFITVTLFSFIWHWNDLYSATMYFTSDVRMLMPNLKNLDRLLVTSNVGVSGYAARTYRAAAPLLTIVPPLILYLFTQRYFTESVERTGIVG